MNFTLLLISILGTVVLTVLTLLSIAGCLLSCDLRRLRVNGSATPRLTRDPLALKVLLVDFFARSMGSSRIIRLLAARQKPVRYQTLVDDFRFDEKWRRDSDGFPANAIPAVLGVMQLAGLVRIARHGFSLTEVGREVHSRIDASIRAERPQPRALRSISGNVRPHATSHSSADRTLRRDLQKRPDILTY